MRYIITLGLMVVLMISCSKQEIQTHKHTNTQTQEIQTHEQLSKIYNSTIQIHSDYGWSGSGCHIGQNRILTAFHVVGGMEEIVYIGEGDDRINFRVIKGDELLDLAIIEPINEHINLDLPVIPIASTGPQLGEKLYASGYNFALPFGKTISEGTLTGSFTEDDISKLWFSCPANPGCSGGPVLNDKYEIVGVVQIGLSRQYAGAVGMNLFEDFIEFMK